MTRLLLISTKSAVDGGTRHSVKLDDRTVDMEVDSGASLSLMAESTFRRLWPGRSLLPSYVRLQTYQWWVAVMASLGSSGGPTLLGRDWMSQRYKTPGLSVVYFGQVQGCVQ